MVFLKLLNIDVLKEALLEKYREINTLSTSPNPSVLTVAQSTLETPVLLGPTTKAVLAIDKIDIGDFICDGFDISAFETIDTTGFQLKEPSELEMETWNEAIGKPLFSASENNINPSQVRTADEIKKYGLFCWLSGFFDLSIDEVALYINDKTMRIVVNEDHIVYKGSVEIKTW